MMEYTETQLHAVLSLPSISMRDYRADNYTVKLTGHQLAELERLVVVYTEALAQYNDLAPGLQVTLDTLASAWEKLANAEAI